MQIVNQMLLHSTSINDLEVNSIHQPDTDSVTDVDWMKGDLKVFPEDFSDTICCKKDFTIKLPGDGCSVVKESQSEENFDDPLGMCSSGIRTDLGNDFQSSADVRGIELEQLVSQDCSRENDGSVLRDIGVDEGVSTNDKILVEDISDGLKCMVEDSNKAKDTKYSLDNISVAVEWPMPVALKSMTQEVSEKDLNACDSKIRVRQSEPESESTYLVSCDPKDKVVDNRCNDKPYILLKDSIAEFRDATDKLSSSAPEDTFKETDMMKVDPGQEAINNLSPPAANNNEVEFPSNSFHPRMADASQMSEQQNLASDHLTSSAHIHRDDLESSFASVGPRTNSISYSGPVAYSGSLSHRSDASTVSTRSFAFPVLQNEWNYSPVRMRKASRRHLGRRRGWMNGLFCCKF